MNKDKIKESIKKDIESTFKEIEKSVKERLKGDFDVSITKRFLRDYLANEVVYKSEVLLDTLINYLMNNAVEKLKDTNINLQNAFYDMDFRKRIAEWANQTKNQVLSKSDSVKYSIDPRLKQGLIVAGVTYIAGSSVTVVLLPTVIGSVVSGLATIIITALSFKIAYEKATPMAREKIRKDVNTYLKQAKEQIEDWLYKVQEAFEKDFEDFCKKNRIKC